MKNLSSYFKSILVSVLTILSFIFCLYLSVIFFVILLADEAIKGKANEMLKEDFAAFIQKFSDFPENFFSSGEKKEMDLSGKLS